MEEADGSGPATARVTIVQGQARAALRLAAAFAVAATTAMVVPHRTGAWLPLHLFLVGSVLLSISDAARLFAVTWSAGEPADHRLVAAQRWLLATGAAGLAGGGSGPFPSRSSPALGCASPPVRYCSASCSVWRFAGVG